MDVLHRDVVDDNSIRRLARRSTVQIVLLNIDAICADVLDFDVPVGDAGNVTRRLSVRLDARAILVVQYLAVLEKNVRNVVVRLAAYAANGQTVAAVAVHIAHGDVIA